MAATSLRLMSLKDTQPDYWSEGRLCLVNRDQFLRCENAIALTGFGRNSLRPAIGESERWRGTHQLKKVCIAA